MQLALVIPVWNDPDGLARLLRQIGAWPVFDQIILVDDASDMPVSAALTALGDRQRLTYLRTDHRLGAGHARNLGLAHVRTSHVIFFDSDDLFTNDFPLIIREATGRHFDFVIFRHEDSRMAERGSLGSFPREEALWNAIDAQPELTPLTVKQATTLCRISAYPWNKIYRTEFLRQNDIRCTETMVHNDLELHWASFIAADHILASSRLGARHFVARGGSRLSNRRDAERLGIFDAFAAVADRLRQAPPQARQAYTLPFYQFADDLSEWVHGHIDQAHHEALSRRKRQFFSAFLNKGLVTLMAYQDPALIRRINASLSGAAE